MLCPMDMSNASPVVAQSSVDKGRVGPLQLYTSLALDEIVVICTLKLLESSGTAAYVIP